MSLMLKKKTVLFALYNTFRLTSALSPNLPGGTSTNTSDWNFLILVVELWVEMCDTCQPNTE